MITELTSRLIKLDGQLAIHNEGEWSNTDSRYSAFNDAGVEIEVGEFLYSMVRILKPENVLETGTHVGIGASYMGLGVMDNGMGHLDTVEFIPELHKAAQERINRLGIQEVVTCHLGDAAQFEPTCRYKMIFLDTEPQTRFAELIKFEPFLEPGGYMFIHDLHRHMAQVGQNPDHPEPFWPWGVLPEEMHRLMLSGTLAKFHFATPRGFTGFYKRHPDDYKL
jgi:hypothetical protein